MLLPTLPEPSPKTTLEELSSAERMLRSGASEAQEAMRRVGNFASYVRRQDTEKVIEVRRAAETYLQEVTQGLGRLAAAIGSGNVRQFSEEKNRVIGRLQSFGAQMDAATKRLK